VLSPIFDTECTNKFQEFKWSVVQNNIFAPEKDSHIWTKAYNKSRFADAEQRLFGTDSYRFFIGTIWHLPGNHQIQGTGTKGPKDFQLNKKVLSPTTTPFPTC
jgi:hypothetical protein